MHDNKTNILDFDLNELQKFITGMGYEKYRADQILEWLGKGIRDYDDMSNLPSGFRRDLSEKTTPGNLLIHKKFVSAEDTTVKYLYKLPDNNIIETVLMEYKHGYSVCVSSQIGCRMGCTFCASTAAGLAGNLTAGEILDQVLSTGRDLGRRIGNIVIMGIGEPFDNYENVLKFIKLANMPQLLNIGMRHITISTCGIVPGILKLCDEEIQVNLSVSLHAADNETRSKIMPINKKYSIDKIIEACKIYTRKTKRRVTFEYIMLKEINDSKEDALELSKRLKGLLCHVNLIAANPVDDTLYRGSETAVVHEFKKVLLGRGIETTIRRELGKDIDAACGQLRRKEM